MWTGDETWKKILVAGTLRSISPINWRTIPFIICCNANSKKDKIRFSIFCSNCYRFDDKPMDFFDKETFMIYFCKDIETNIQYLAHCWENTLEGTAIIKNNKMMDTKLSKHMLHKMICKSCWCFIRD